MRTFNLLGPSADERVSELYGLAPYLVYKVGDKTYNYGAKAANNLFYNGALAGVNPTEILAIGAGVTTLYELCRGKGSLTKVHAENWDTSATATLYGMFWLCTGLIDVDLSHLNTSAVTSMAYMFYNAENVQRIGLPMIKSGCDVAQAFFHNYALTDVRCGGLIYPSVSFSDSPLAAASVIDILDHLADTPDAGATITFKSGLYATYSAEDKARIDALRTAAVANGWTIANMS